jgi:glucose/arabinose dehydrogenase
MSAKTAVCHLAILTKLAMFFARADASADLTKSITNIPDGVVRTPYRIEQIATDLRVPWELAFLPDGRILFTEREGRVRVIQRGRLLRDPALSIDVAHGNKMGMLGIAQDPAFRQNHFIYVAYDYEVEASPGDEAPSFRLRVARYRLQGNNLVEPRTLIEDVPAATNHTGSRLVFGPHDGKLYVSAGDADRPLNAQRLDRLNGKIIRLNPDGSIPPDNPFIGTLGARAEIWSYGHRNPQGLVFEPQTGRMLDTEHTVPSAVMRSIGSRKATTTAGRSLTMHAHRTEWKCRCLNSRHLSRQERPCFTGAALSQN